MKYTIVWNQNKTEGIILSGEDAPALADRFRDKYTKYGDCTIQNGLVPMQPTPCMIHAGQSEFYRCKDRGLTSPESVINIWQAMVQEMNK